MVDPSNAHISPEFMWIITALFALFMALLGFWLNNLSSRLSKIEDSLDDHSEKDTGEFVQIRERLVRMETLMKKFCKDTIDSS